LKNVSVSRCDDKFLVLLHVCHSFSLDVILWRQQVG
jgi:hypothetical protein